MAITSVDDFLEQLGQSNLFGPEQLSQLRSNLPSDNNIEARKLAVVLVKRGLLSRWQAEKLLAGKKFNFVLGKYKIIEQIGKGGRGDVYKAEQMGLDRIVALKVLPKELVSKKEAVERFKREAQVASRLSHGNIINCYDAECEGDTHFLVMEYMDGKDLNRWLDEAKPLPVNWSCEVIRQAALGLQHAHAQGMVHRDIKPSNILASGQTVEERPVAKLLDMGFARIVSEAEDEEVRLTRPWQVFGTPDYMSPEQAESTANADIRSDIYSLGITFWKLLVGDLPFQGGSPLQKLIARAKRDAPPVREFRPEVPEEVAAIVAKMLARLPDERYQAPGEVAAALTPYSMSPDEAVDFEAAPSPSPADAAEPAPVPPEPAPPEPAGGANGPMMGQPSDNDMMPGEMMPPGEMMEDMAPPEMTPPSLDEPSPPPMEATPPEAGVGPAAAYPVQPFPQEATPMAQAMPAAPQPPQPAEMPQAPMAAIAEPAQVPPEPQPPQAAAPNIESFRVDKEAVKQAVLKAISMGVIIGGGIGWAIGLVVGFLLQSVFGGSLLIISITSLVTLGASLATIYLTVTDGISAAFDSVRKRNR